MTSVLFDLDGTLHDRLVGLRAFASDHACLLGIAKDQREQFVARFLQLDANGRVWKDQVYSQLRQEFESSRWPSTATLVNHYITGFSRFSVETPGAASLLHDLNAQGIKLGIVTNGRSDLQRSVITALGFDRFMTAIIISEEVGCRKPQTEIFDIALASVAADPREAIMVGDDPVADVEGALTAGIFSIGFQCASGHPVEVVQSMQDVRDAVLKHIRGCPGA